MVLVVINPRPSTFIQFSKAFVYFLQSKVIENDFALPWESF